ncbi:MAG: RnfABCDGE type electron transport complex subunit D [Gallionellaceae bacterium]|nr:RnfABCDGE type electron transport complex subunit D [Gallionellaceae bacterium]MDD5365994.1 RnfABCDGE type electron transport complex subunit D [Gallionellaceae bacterium]
MTTLTHSPHAHAPISIGRVMATVMAALVPTTLYGFWLYGWPAILLWSVAMASALLGEAFILRIQGRAVRPALLDGSGALTAWLLALSLPPFAPWWIAVVGALFAVVIAKQVFGGLGQNVFNPAMAARVMLLISFPVEMTLWAAPTPLTAAQAPGFMDALAITFGGGHWDAMASASLLGHVKTEFTRGVDLTHSFTGQFALADAAWGSRTGSLGETAALLILAGGIFLIARRIVTWHAPVAMLLGVAIPALIGHAVNPARFLDVWPHLLSGGVMLGAFFIATDPVTSPNTGAGQFVFGFGCGLLTWVIRSFGGYPEGVAFAVLLMNAAAPVIDRYVKPRIYGRTRKGAALPVKGG